MIKKNIYLMYAIAFLHGMVFYGPVATLYRQAQGVSVFQITVMESISLAVCLLLELPWGIAADKIGYQRTMLICCFLFFISKIIFWRATGFLGFLCERILLSVVVSGLSGVDTSILYLSCKRENTQHVFGVYTSLETSGLLAASLLFSLYIQTNYRLAALLTVVSYGIAALLSMFLVEVRSTKDYKKKYDQREFFKILCDTAQNKKLLLFLAGVALLNETHQTITVFLNQLQFVKCNMTEAMIGVTYSAVTVAGLCSSLSSKITVKLGELRLVKLCYGTAFAACAAVAVTSSAVVSIIGILLLRITFSLFQPLQTNLQNRQVLSQNRATVLSTFAVVINSIGVFTNVIFGALANVNISLSLWAGACLCAAGYIVMAFWAKTTNHKFLQNQ